jgi:mono/diheme cytochrome c family protein
MRIFFAAVFVAVFLAALALCQNTGYQPDPNWVAPERAVARQNPLSGKAQAAAGGKKLFLRHCAECHNTDGSGLKQAADLQLPVVQSQTDGTLFWKITNGNLPRNMPSFSNLPETQRWQIVMFLRTLKSAQSSTE